MRNIGKIVEGPQKAVTGADLCRLRHGTLHRRDLVAVVVLMLDELATQAPSVLFELATLAREPSYRPDEEIMALLGDNGLLRGGELHSSFRDVIVAATEINEFSVTVVFPYDEDNGQPPSAKGQAEEPKSILW